MRFTTGLNAYLLDQLLLLFIFLGFLVGAFYRRDLSLKPILLLVFLFFFLILIVFQSEVLDRYFIKEDYYLLLGNLNLSMRDPTNTLYNVWFYKLYPYISFAILFQLFRLNAFYYNLASLASMALGATLLYQLLIYLIKPKTFSTKMVIFLLSLVYVLSPIIMEIYVWVQLGHANGFIISSILLSLYFYLKFIEKGKTIFFSLSFLLILFLLKTALVRAAFWPFCLIFLDLLYHPKTKEGRFGFLIRTGYFLLPLFVVTFPIMINPITKNNYSLFERFYIFFYNIIPSIIPYQIYLPAYKFILSLKNLGINHEFFYNNIFFVFGILFFVLITIFTFILQKTPKARLLLFFWFCSLLSLIFFTLFSNWGPPPSKGSADGPLISYATVPSSRYHVYTSIFILTSCFLMLSTFLVKYPKFNYILILLFLLLIGSNIKFAQAVNKSINESGSIPLKLISEIVLENVPDIDEQRVIYHVGGQPRVVQFLGYNGFEALYKFPPANAYSEEELVDYLSKNEVNAQYLFAYTYNIDPSKFENKSEQFVKKYHQYLK